LKIIPSFKPISSGQATAMIDTSDGLLADLGHICQESGKGADLVKTDLPVSREMKERAIQKKTDPAELCLKDSDDYELIFTCSPQNVQNLKQTVARISDVPVTEIGKITGTAGLLQWIYPDGRRERIEATGWDHFDSRGDNHV
jgi:thiamine-monophosphate kinase